MISDGKLTKEQIRKEYQKRGYSIVAFTDHRTYGYHPELTYEAVIKAMKEGNFYFSMAPEIHEAKIEDGVLKVKTSPVEKIFVVTDSRDCYKKLAPEGETITEAEFPVNGKDGWVRIQIRDGKGKYAGTNAVYLEGMNHESVIK